MRHGQCIIFFTAVICRTSDTITWLRSIWPNVLGPFTLINAITVYDKSCLRYGSTDNGKGNVHLARGCMRES